MLLLSNLALAGTPKKTKPYKVEEHTRIVVREMPLFFDPEKPIFPFHHRVVEETK